MPIDYKKYPLNWKTEITPRIKKRSGDKCEVCGLKNHSKIFSVNLKIQDSKDGRYKNKTFWLSDFRDVKRLMTFHNIHTYKIVQVVLTVGHINHDETNWDIMDKDLKHMCQWCHLNYDAQEKYKRKNGNMITLHQKFEI